MVLSFEGTSREFITNLVSEPVYTTAPKTHFVLRNTYVTSQAVRIARNNSMTEHTTSSKTASCSQRFVTSQTYFSFFLLPSTYRAAKA